MFLADDAVVRISLGDLAPDEQLDLAVGLRHHVLVALALDGERIELSEKLHAELAGALGEIAGKVEAFAVAGHGGPLPLEGFCRVGRAPRAAFIGKSRALEKSGGD